MLRATRFKFWNSKDIVVSYYSVVLSSHICSVFMVTNILLETPRHLEAGTAWKQATAQSLVALYRLLFEIQYFEKFAW